MSDPNYPDDIRNFDHDPRSPFYKDPTETAAFEDIKQEMLEERMGKQVAEALCEMNPITEGRLSKAVLALEAAEDYDSKRLAIYEISSIVWSIVHNYCEPPDDEVLDALEQWNNGDTD